ncbi:peptide chain release factor N(5)-glutamine methyltransferase [Corynebacterium freneyi]|nr:peptide chain release factor N(5)-glutamine methyltransferase [Corynebacterium freneyi]
MLSEVAAALADAGCASPQADAEQLMMHVSGRSRTDLILSRRDPVAADDPLVAELPALVVRRAAREPLQHILGTAPMGRLELAVGPGVFVPRPETELLAEWCITALGDVGLDDDPHRRKAGAPAGNGPVVVDLCTGSGALALAIADRVPAASVTGVELDPVAAEWARRNLDSCRELWAGEATPRTGAVRIIAGDVTDPGLVDGADAPLADLRGRVDLVVSNPPYVPLATYVDAEVRHDPHHAVFGGDDGLDVIRPMLNIVRELLAPGGAVAIEHDDDSGADVSELLAGTGFCRDIEVHRDLAGRDRFTTAYRCGGGHRCARRGATGDGATQNDSTRDTNEGTDQAT